MLLIESGNGLISPQALDNFRKNKNGILVASDVAARGLDLPGVRMVIHYQLPRSAEVSGTFFSCLNWILCIFCVYLSKVILLS